MTLSDRILELRIWWAWRRFERIAPLPENMIAIVNAHAEALKLQRQRRPEVVKELDRQRMERCRNEF